MKVAIVVLLILGVLAAGSTALLFGWVQTRNAGQSPAVAMVDVVLAEADLPARTRLVADHVKVERVPQAGLPAGCYINKAQAIGKTLKIAVVKGQPLTAVMLSPGDGD